ncbi:MAG: cellulase family glycosylhydrolase [Gemmatimonadetes bacterium]|nr:cellulase family glycosylhydrolase [Gemmatimonadota bacterium]
MPGDAPANALALGRGINLGNILEATNEGAWGLRLTDDLFDAAKTAGASTVRLPVRFSNHALAQRPYTLDENFLVRIDYAIDAALARGMRIVLDMHHHRQLDGDALDAGELAVDPAILEERFIAIWRQLAVRYRMRPESVLFELNDFTAPRWNSLLSRTIAAIREVETTRYLVVGPVGNTAGELASLVLPATDRRIVVTIHSYEPFDFTHQGADWAGLGNSPTTTCCTAAQVARWRADVARRWSDQWQRPVWEGGRTAAPSARVPFARARCDGSARFTWACWQLAGGIRDLPAGTRSWRGVAGCAVSLGRTRGAST